MLAISEFAVAVLPDEGILLSLVSSWSDSGGGEANRAVGRGPAVANGLRDFFKIGCDGGGFDALDDRFLEDTTFDFIRGDSGRSCVQPSPLVRCATMSCLVNGGTWK